MNQNKVRRWMITDVENMTAHDGAENLTATDMTENGNRCHRTTEETPASHKSDSNSVPFAFRTGQRLPNDHVSNTEGSVPLH